MDLTYRELSIRVGGDENLFSKIHEQACRIVQQFDPYSNDRDGAAQEILCRFLSAVKKDGKRFDHYGQIVKYLKVVAVRYIIDCKRKGRGKKLIISSELIDSKAIESDSKNSFVQEIFERTLKYLEIKEQDLLISHYLLNIDDSICALAFGCPENTLRSNRSRALKRFRGIIERLKIEAPSLSQISMMMKSNVAYDTHFRIHSSAVIKEISGLLAGGASFIPLSPSFCSRLRKISEHTIERDSNDLYIHFMKEWDSSLGKRVGFETSPTTYYHNGQLVDDYSATPWSENIYNLTTHRYLLAGCSIYFPVTLFVDHGIGEIVPNSVVSTLDSFGNVRPGGIGQVLFAPRGKLPYNSKGEITTSD